jgi:signal transduction histidine kinase
MSTTKPASTRQGHQGSSFANALRDCSACGIFCLRGEDQPVALNAEAARILDLKPGKGSSVAFKSLPEPVQEFGREALRSGGALPRRKIELPSGRRREVEMQAVALPKAGAEAGGAVVLVTDLGPMRALEEDLQQLDRLANIGTLSASMAHEIRNALVAGKTFMDVLLEKHQDAELVGIVRREISRIDAIVSRMLKFTGAGRPMLSPVHLHEVLEHSLRLVRPQMESQSVALEQSFTAPADRIKGDEYELQQAFVNLFLNALEAMGPGGTLTVRTEYGSDSGSSLALRETAEPPPLRIIIQDTGAGIPAEARARLFEPFFTTKPGGTGLGLAITQRIIQEHRGAISVESQPGRGTVFQIALPLLDRPARTQAGASGSPR